MVDARCDVCVVELGPLPLHQHVNGFSICGTAQLQAAVDKRVLCVFRQSDPSVDDIAFVERAAAEHKQIPGGTHLHIADILRNLHAHTIECLRGAKE